VIKIEDEFLKELSERAGTVERKRLNYNYHKVFSDLLQRMLNAIEPGSYIRPHKHDTPDKREVFIILKGRTVVVEFNDDGTINDYIVLDPKNGVYGVEIAPKKWHTIISLEKGSVVYEVKDGPYEPIDDKNFAAWAPAESDARASAYLENLITELKLQ
jgi:cupin fold WbuC family metalloprotein